MLTSRGKQKMETLIKLIKSRKALIGIIGLGYAGLPLVIRFGEEGFNIKGFDIDENKVKKLNSGKSYIKHIKEEHIQSLIKTGQFIATSDFSLLKEIDCIIICVPTPLTDKKEPDLTYVINTAGEIAAYLRAGQIISLESTTYPGTTEEILLPEFSARGFLAGKDFFLVFSPEREDPANPYYYTGNIPKVIGGITENCLKAGKALYEQVVDRVIPVSSTKVAEMSKLLENIYRSVNIALVNELKILCDRMDIDIWEVIEAASTKPFGFTPFYPGPGLGGHCIPVDPFYLSWKAKEYGFNTRFIELAGEVNVSMPSYVVNKVIDGLNEKEKSLKGSRILLLGMAYKKDVDDRRESPGLAIFKILQDKGAAIFYNDPHIPYIRGLRSYNYNISSVELTEELLKSMDVTLIVTDHSSYDYEWIVNNSQLVVDTRNGTKHVRKNRNKIIKA
jgi:UDP-N-acetyl-D-glucosamine dehydrogenase